ncbi:MAG: hypothetical protein BGO40_05670 [Chryseobacterium sp. 39-10]|nr:VWA domain-containing protein [Chryseobacterium sp.]ODU59392.1 MAG: hypothetical protein ABT12_01370 [Paludibacter sp. SCN 51-9]OJV47295.1 MAG: hypothetical protein BGO40_05670 [Chryseobacterium sp. 39-10]
MKTEQIHNVIILDESGSMMSIKNQIISGFNETTQSIRNAQKNFPQQEHTVSVITFNGEAIKTLHLCDSVDQLKEIDANLYQPDDATPLFDAIGKAVAQLNSKIDTQVEHHVLVTILTDGEENDSREFTGKDIKKIIENLKEKNWTFTYIGTDHDVDAIALKLSITNTLIFEKNDEGIDKMFQKEQSARNKYYAKINRKEDTKGDFFDDSI